MKNKMIIPLFIGFMFIVVGLVYSATFTVNTIDDTVDVNPGDGIASDVNGKCSLRAAIMQANALLGKDNIIIPNGRYKLTIEGVREDNCLRGDLDIKSSMEIQGAEMGKTIINGNQLDRIFHIHGSHHITFSNITIRNGEAPDGVDDEFCKKVDGGNGGGVLNHSGTVTINNCKIKDNLTGNGAYLCYYMGYGGDGGDGGGIYNGEGKITLTNCYVEGNKTGKGGWEGYHGNGGGICSGGELILINCEVSNNMTNGSAPEGYSGCGGGVCTFGTAIISKCLISGNKIGVFENDDGGGLGGGIYNVSNMVIEDSTISENIAGSDSIGYPGLGGGICNFYISEVKNCTISNNSSSDGGGGVCTGEGGISRIKNCTICNNKCDRVCESGGGIQNLKYYWYTKNSAKLLNSTTKIKNSIIANNQKKDCAGWIISEGYNLIKKIRGCTIRGVETGNIYRQDPKLGVLKDNGGPTETHALLEGSPAIDAGDPDEFEPYDQRGVNRPVDGDGDGIAITDIGAVEHSLPSVSINSPLHGSTIFGTVPVKINVKNADQLVLYINEKSIHTCYKEPYIFDWDTIPFNNGAYQIKAVVSDKIGQAAEDEITVYVNNVIINLSVSRYVERAWIIKRDYGKITFTVNNTDALNLAKYIIYRKVAAEVFQSIKEVSVSALQGGSYTYHDLFPDKNGTYTYRVEALDEKGMVIGCSKEEKVETYQQSIQKRNKNIDSKHRINF